eukprot:9374973-Prorocentrum_lima.AAC.1
MTSSLVGSEMCIRDSPGERFNKEGSIKDAFLYPVESCSIIIVLFTPNACLLYTSDAADDM